MLIVTNRPAIANSWYDDFIRFIGHQTSFKFVSESASLADRAPMTRAQWPKYLVEHEDEDPRIVEFRESLPKTISGKIQRNKL